MWVRPSTSDDLAVKRAASGVLLTLSRFSPYGSRACRTID
jgi:hypothetical protein